MTATGPAGGRVAVGVPHQESECRHESDPIPCLGWNVFLGDRR